MKTKTFTANCFRCGKEYQAIRSTSLYCSASCRQMVYVEKANQRYKEYLEEKQRWLQEQNSLPHNHTVNTKNKNADKTHDTVKYNFYKMAIVVIDRKLASTNTIVTSTETMLPST